MEESGMKHKLRFHISFEIEVDSKWYPEGVESPEAIKEWEEKNADIPALMEDRVYDLEVEVI